MKNFTTALLVFFLSIGAFAQSKVGTIDINLIISSMEEDMVQVQKELEIYGTELDGKFKEMVAEYQTAVKAYQEAEATATEEDKKKKQQEIMGMEQDLQRLKQNSQSLVQIKQNQLMQPMYQKVGQALDVIAREQNFTQVLTLDSEVVYFDPALDLTALVAKKLGVTLKNPEENPAE